MDLTKDNLVPIWNKLGLLPDLIEDNRPLNITLNTKGENIPTSILKHFIMSTLSLIAPCYMYILIIYIAWRSKTLPQPLPLFLMKIENKENIFFLVFLMLILGRLSQGYVGLEKGLK